jgi:hypothetical protein
MDDLYATTRNLRRVEAEQRFHIDVFGDHLAQNKGYKKHSGVEAVWFYLVATVRALNTRRLGFRVGRRNVQLDASRGCKAEGLTS